MRSCRNVRGTQCGRAEMSEVHSAVVLKFECVLTEQTGFVVGGRRVVGDTVAASRHAFTAGYVRRTILCSVTRQRCDVIIARRRGVTDEWLEA